MYSINSVVALREQLHNWRRAGDRIALVPTMGNLHEGHLSLVRIAQENAQRVVVTIFVNPSQFAEGEDFSVYPRTMERDKELLSDVGADMLFTPDVDIVYPFGVQTATSVAVPVLTDEFCGASRPGHFDGVTSVVLRLFNYVQADVAVFGEKDYQQLQVIKRMVADLAVPLEIIAGPTQRESDGLALSSRNRNLSDEQRKIAAGMYGVLVQAGQQLQAGIRDYGKLEQQGIDDLGKLGFTPDYFAVRRADTLEIPGTNSKCKRLVILAAAHLGEARLIDNIVVSI